MPARLARTLVLAAVFTCAACGLVYELALVALGSYLVGNSVTQASIVLSVMVFAMGVGSLAAKPLQRPRDRGVRGRRGLLALIGGVSVLVLYAAFAWLDLYVPALVVVSFAVGALIGAEIPLLMTLLPDPQAGRGVRGRRPVRRRLRGRAGRRARVPVPAAARVRAHQGRAARRRRERGRRDGGRAVAVPPPGRARRRVLLALGMVAVLGVLGGTYALADDFEVSARQALYSDPIAISERTKYQEIVITRQAGLGPSDLRLFLNGDLCSRRWTSTGTTSRSSIR